MSFICGAGVREMSQQRQVVMNATSFRFVIRCGKDSVQALLRSATVTCNKVV